MKRMNNCDKAGKDDDMAFFENLYLSYYKLVCDYIYYVFGCRNRRVTEIIALEVFRVAYENLEEVKKQQHPLRWLIRTASDKWAEVNRDDDR